MVPWPSPPSVHTPCALHPRRRATPPRAGLVALPLWGLANWFRAAVPAAWAWALGLHLFSWFAQIVFGHQMAERRKPALLDSFFQVGWVLCSGGWGGGGGARMARSLGVTMCLP